VPALLLLPGLALSCSTRTPRCPTPPPAAPRAPHGWIKHRFAVVADQDKAGRGTAEWRSYLQFGELQVADGWGRVNLSMAGQRVDLTSKLNRGSPSQCGQGKESKGRGLELSELQQFGKRLLAPDDKTGILYSLSWTGEERAVPWLILSDGAGNREKPMKAEWSVRKDGSLLLGGWGKEWTTPTGEIGDRSVALDPLWVKQVSCEGAVTSLNWTENFLAVRRAVGIEFPGYLGHEAVGWSEQRREWTFLPRRASTEPYNDAADEKRGTNLMITASEDFAVIEHRRVGRLDTTRGFSSFKFVPGTQDNLILALKTKEITNEDHTTEVASYILAFDIDGKILHDETKISDTKLEGIEFF